MGITELLDHLPDSVSQPPEQLWPVFARSLAEQGAAGRTALAWRWALTGACPSPVALTQPPGRAPTRGELTAEAAAPAELARPGSDPGGQVMHSRSVLQWLAGELDAVPLWNCGHGGLHLTDGTPFPRTAEQVTDVHSRALLAEWRHPWPADLEADMRASAACGYARGVAQLLTWTSGAAGTGPLSGEPTARRPPSPYQVALEVRGARAGLENARATGSAVLAGRMEGVIDTFAWLTGWTSEPPADRHGHVTAEDCPDRDKPCGCDAARMCLRDACLACRSVPCIHGFDPAAAV